MSQNVLSMWTVYERPRDYPQGYIARRFEIGRGPEPLASFDVVTGSLDEIRDYMKRHGLTRMVRQTDDQPQIVESWI